MILKSLFLERRQGLRLRYFLISLCLLLLASTAISILTLFRWNGWQTLSIGRLLRAPLHLLLGAPITHPCCPLVTWLW